MTLLSEIRERAKNPWNAEFQRKDVQALLEMIEGKDEALNAARRILSIYVTDSSPQEDIIDANMIDDALALGHGGRGGDDAGTGG